MEAPSVLGLALVQLLILHLIALATQKAQASFFKLPPNIQKLPTYFSNQHENQQMLNAPYYSIAHKKKLLILFYLHYQFIQELEMISLNKKIRFSLEKRLKYENIIYTSNVRWAFSEALTGVKKNL